MILTKRQQNPHDIVLSIDDDDDDDDF